MIKLIKALLAATALIGVGVPTAQASLITWDGGAGDNLLTSANNWNPNQSPASGDTLNIADGSTVLHENNLPSGSIINLTGGSGLQVRTTVIRLNGSTINVGSGSALTGGNFGFDMNNGTVTFQDGAIYGNTTWENKGTNIFNFELGTSGFTTLTPGNFRLGGGATMANATYAVDFANFTDGPGAYSITLVDYGADPTNTSTAGWEASTESFLNVGGNIVAPNLSWDAGSDSVNLNFTVVVPEPTTALGVLGLVASTFLRRRRRTLAA